MKREEKQKIYEKELSQWAANNIQTECFKKTFEGCEGHYTKRPDQNRLECDKCGTGLVFPSYEEVVSGRRRRYVFQVSDLESRISIKQKERNELNAQIKVLQVDLKKAKQQHKKWR